MTCPVGEAFCSPPSQRPGSEREPTVKVPRICQYVDRKLEKMTVDKY
jgi:hypothetical protein